LPRDGERTTSLPHDSRLESLLAAELSDAWASGRPLAVEELLRRHPELVDDAEAVIRLIHEEVRHRNARGDQVTREELCRRFPRWARELSVMLDCRRLVEEHLRPPAFPSVGQTLGDFLLLAELGRGAHGRVFLASQPALAGRPVVLKVTPRHDREYHSLARLQHTHIIPLHAAYDFPELHLRALCQPYFGGASLSVLLAEMSSVPAPERTGRDLVAALTRASRGPGLPLPERGGPVRSLEKMAYADAVVWIGSCLAEALHYAHERGLVHLDLKPSNVLIAADGQPLLLDFHLAHQALTAGQPIPASLGGTPGYMSPEQQAAYTAACRQEPLPIAVDHRSDIFSLGRLLYWALGGDERNDFTAPAPLRDCNPRVSVGLADIVHRCLNTDPSERYATAGELAADLRRHLTHQPLTGVANRSFRESWQKWRRRHPYAPLWAGMLLALVAVPLVVAGIVRYAPPIAAPAPAAPGADFWAHFHAGVRAHRAGQTDDALRSFTAAMALAPDVAEVHYNRALAYAAAGDNAKAIGDLDRALSLKPTFATASLNRGILHFKDGRHAEALADFERALENGADPATTHFNISLVRLAQGQNVAARESLMLALRHEPGYTPAKTLMDQLARE
jgi:serine/threonine protein kinase